MKYFYVYGIIANESMNEISVQGLQSTTIQLYPYQSISLAFSIYDIEEGEVVSSSRQNLLAHQKVTEAILAHTTIIPFKFGTLMPENEVQSFLSEQESTLKTHLETFEGKVEFSLKGFWTDMSSIFAQIVAHQPEIKARQQALASQPNPPQNDLIEVGKMVEQAFLAHKSELTQEIIDILQPAILQSKVNDNIMEAMFANIALLIDRNQEKLLDRLINQAAEQFGEQTKFKYLGPSAPVNFVNLIFNY